MWWFADGRLKIGRKGYPVSIHRISATDAGRARAHVVQDNFFRRRQGCGGEGPLARRLHKSGYSPHAAPDL